MLLLVCATAATMTIPTAFPQLDVGVSWVTGFVPVAKGELFYAFVPHANRSAPLMLWLQGGPGASGIQDGLLTINGPLSVSPGGDLVRRNVTWASSFAMLYIDQPVGTGYSFATNTSDMSSYASSSYPEASSMLTTFLDAMYNDLKLWPRAAPLLIAGESYGGHYCPALATALLEANAARPPADAFNLRGVAIGDGLTDPATQVLSKPPAAFTFGLIGSSQLEVANILAQNASRLAAQGEYIRAKAAREAMERIVKSSGVNLYDVRIYGGYDDSGTTEWLSRPTTAARLGIPTGHSFGTNRLVEAAMEADVMKSYKGLVPRLLKELPLGLLLYQGQFDWKDGASSNEAWVASLQSTEAAAYLNASRVPLRAATLTQPYGWSKGAGKLHDVILRGAGHMAPRDQPKAAFDMIQKWVSSALPGQRGQDVRASAIPLPSGPHPWPTNFNGTLYMYADPTYMQRKHVDYRWTTKQYLNVVESSPDNRTRDCVVLFDSDASIWEWHTASRSCTKIFDRFGTLTPYWTSFMSNAHGTLDVRNAVSNYSATCNKYCADGGPCICEATQDGVPHAPIWHSHVDETGKGGWSIYEDMVLTPELASERITRPSYCPGPDTKPLFDESMCPGFGACLQATCFNCFQHPEAPDCPNGHTSGTLR